MKKLKKRKNILWHILFPVVLILVLIPPVCSLVFWHFSDRFAHYAAASEHGKLQEPMTSLISETFSDSASEMGIDTRREQIRGFLIQVQAIRSWRRGTDLQGTGKLSDQRSALRKIRSDDPDSARKKEDRDFCGG